MAKTIKTARTTARKTSQKASVKNARRVIPMSEATDDQLARCAKVSGFDEVPRLEKFVYGDDDAGNYKRTTRRAAIREFAKCGWTHVEIEGGWCAPIEAPRVAKTKVAVKDTGLKYHATKDKAVAHIRKLGFTVLFDKGSCGDNGHGSRLYFKRPDAKLNPHGVPYDRAEVSFLYAGRWSSSVFDGNGANAPEYKFEVEHSTFSMGGTKYNSLNDARRAVLNPDLVRPEDYVVVEYTRAPAAKRWTRKAVHALDWARRDKTQRVWAKIGDSKGSFLRGQKIEGAK